MFFALFNYNKAFIFFLAFRLFLNLNICFDIPGMPLLTLDVVMISYFFSFYLLKYNHRQYISYPLKKATLFFILVDFITVLFSLGGFANSLTPTLYHVLDLILLYMIWNLIDMDSYRLLLWLLFFVSLMAGIYCIYEKKEQFNPLALYEIQLGGARAVDWIYNISESRGYRAQSIFIHPIGAGANFAFLSFLFLYYFLNEKKNLGRFAFLFFVASFLMIICCFFANSRGPIVYLIIASLPLFFISNKRTRLFIISSVIIFLFVTDIASEYSNMVMSIFDIENGNGYVGSDKNMRLSQLEAALNIFFESPLWGLGTRGYEFYHNKGIVSQLLGLESIWLMLLVEKGALGIFAYLYFVKSVLSIKLTVTKKNLVFFLTIAYVALCSVTSIPGGLIYIHYLLIFYLIKSDRLWLKYQHFK